MLARRILTLLLFIVSTVLLFWRLDGIRLWRDEATTANWARVMVNNGSWLPYTFDHGQLIAQADDGHDVGSKLLPAMQSWLQFYVTALSFRFLGVSEFSARLPYAILGAVSLFVLYRLGIVLFGPGILPLTLPALTVTSVHFLNATRQSRYYVIVVLAASWLLLEFCRYLRDPAVARRRSFYVRLCLAGFLMYFSNYVSFAGMWAALGLFVLLLRDVRLIRNFIALSAGMAVVIGLDFWLFHSEFAGQWPPPAAVPPWDRYLAALIGRGRDLWRTVPLTLLIPAAFYLLRRHAPRLPPALAAGLAFSCLVVLSPLVLAYDSGSAGDASDVVRWGWVAACLAVPVTLAFGWSRLKQHGVWTRAALLAALVVILSPAIAIAAGKEQTSQRHYYQIVPAAVLLTSLAAAGLERAANRTAAMAFFAAALLWPAMDVNQGCCDQVVERQFLLDDSYTGPLIDFLKQNIGPGDAVAFYRNVNGMMAYFYLPEMHWVALLNSEAPHNRQFRGVIPDDQFDDYPDVKWYVLWDPRGGRPRGLREEKYEKVWEYTYPYRLGWWDRNIPAPTRTYEVYKRREAPPVEAPAHTSN